MELSTNGIQKWILLISLLIKLTLVKGKIFKPVEGSTTIHTVCANEGDPLRFSNPFDPALATGDSFFMAQWKKKEKDDSKEVKIMSIRDASGEEIMDTADKRFTKYQFWGLQLSGLKHSDSGIYMASILDTSHTTMPDMIVRVIVAFPPTLKSEALKMKVVKSDDRMSVRCGQVNSLGIPPVQLVLTSDNGTALKGNYSQGFVSVSIDSKKEAGSIHCSIKGKPPASQCIPAEDIRKWDTSHNFGRSTASAGLNAYFEGSTTIIIGVAIGILFLLVIIVVVLILVKRLRSRGRKDLEDDGRRDSKEAHFMDTGTPMGHLMAHSDYNDDDDEDPYNRSVSSKPYLPSKAASPYAVSGLKINDNGRGDNQYASVNNRPRQPQQQQQNNRSPIYKQPPVVKQEGESDDDDLVDSKVPIRKDRNRNVNSDVSLDSRKSWAGVVDNFKEKTQQQQQQQQQSPQQQQPPVAMKRNRLFTRSSDGLNLTDREKGDMGGGGGENVGTLV